MEAGPTSGEMASAFMSDYYERRSAKKKNRKHANHLDDTVGVLRPEICEDCKELVKTDPVWMRLADLEKRITQLEHENRTRRLGGW